MKYRSLQKQKSHRQPEGKQRNITGGLRPGSGFVKQQYNYTHQKYRGCCLVLFFPMALWKMTENSFPDFDVILCLIMILWSADEKHYKNEEGGKIIEITLLRTATLWQPCSITEMDYSIGQKNKLKPSSVLCSSVSYKGRARRKCSWWLRRVTSLSGWGNRRWHLADSLTLADLLGLGWLLWFWNYTLDELDHFCKKEAEMGQTGDEPTLKQAEWKGDVAIFWSTGWDIISVWTDSFSSWI